MFAAVFRLSNLVVHRKREMTHVVSSSQLNDHRIEVSWSDEMEPPFTASSCSTAACSVCRTFRNEFTTTSSRIDHCRADESNDEKTSRAGRAMPSADRPTVFASRQMHRQMRNDRRVQMCRCILCDRLFTMLIHCYVSTIGHMHNYSDNRQVTGTDIWLSTKATYVSVDIQHANLSWRINILNIVY